EFIVCIFGILKTGAYYLPFLPNADFNQQYVNEQKQNASVIIDDDFYIQFIERSDRISSHTLPKLDPESPAVLLFTSGTTSQPKGILISHKAITSLVKSQNYFKLNQDDCFIQLSNRQFDASLFEIFGALLNGKQL